MTLATGCNRKRLADFLIDQLEVEDKLLFLDHLETCPRCWREVYNARKAEHPHYYKQLKVKLKLSDKEIKRLESPTLTKEEEDDVAYQVA